MIDVPALVASYRIGDYPRAGLHSHPWSETATPALLLNAFDLLANPRTRATAQQIRDRCNDVHEYVDFKGPIVLDSGAYNFLRHPQISIACEDVLEVGLDLNVDALVVLDHPFPPDATSEEIDRRLEHTRANTCAMFEALERHQARARINCRLMPVLHGHDTATLAKSFDDIVSAGQRAPDLVGIGSLAPLAMNGNTRKAVDVILAARRLLPEAHIHVFSMGSALLMLFAFYCGADTVDSQSWMLTAAFKQVQLPGCHQTRLSKQEEERDPGAYRRIRRAFAQQLLRLAVDEGFRPKDWDTGCDWPVAGEQDALAYLDSLEDRPGENRVHFRACHNLYAFNFEASRVRKVVGAGDLESFMSDRITSTTYKRVLDYAIKKKATVNEAN